MKFELEDWAMKKYILLGAFALTSLQCSSLFYSIMPRHKLSDAEIKSIEIGKTQFAAIAPKLGFPRRIGHKSNGNQIRLFQYFDPYPGSHSGLKIETDDRGIIMEFEYQRTNDDDLAFYQIYGRNHVIQLAE